MNPIKDQKTMNKMTTQPSATPRTDAVAIRGASTAFPRASYFVDSDFARALEAELAAARAECERLKSTRWKYADDPEMVFTDDWGWLHITTKAGIDEGVAELARLRAENERLTRASVYVQKQQLEPAIIRDEAQLAASQSL